MGLIYIEDLIKRYPLLAPLQRQLVDTYEILRSCYLDGKTVYIAGNGGSCADAEHIAGELMKGFMKKRPLTDADKSSFSSLLHGEAVSMLLQKGIPAIALTSPALMTAVQNDISADMVFAQPLYVLGQAGDVFIGISTSGNALNVYNTAVVAKVRSMKVVALTGKTGGRLREVSDICLSVPETETYKVQELHLPIYHAICAQLEDDFFD